MQLKVIAYARNGHTDKFGIPRQSREESPIVTRIVFEPEYNAREALRGMEGYSHLWIIWGFNGIPQSTWSPTVRPPRLGGNKRMGVFATRSPFRPNPIGLSSVRLLGIRNQESGTKTMELLVSGADLLDGTPIYDIKPYLSFSDCHPDARNGFAEETKDYRLKVEWVEDSILGGIPFQPGNNQVVIPQHIRRDIAYILSQDPRPAYQDDPDREYKMDYSGYTVTFKVQNDTVLVVAIQNQNVSKY